MKPIFASFLALLALPTSSLAAVGGHCSNNWGNDCICLDRGACQNTWKGVAYAGSPGNYPCPADPNNVMACIIRPCRENRRVVLPNDFGRRLAGNQRGVSVFHPSSNRHCLFISLLWPIKIIGRRKALREYVRCKVAQVDSSREQTVIFCRSSSNIVMY